MKKLSIHVIATIMIFSHLFAFSSERTEAVNLSEDLQITNIETLNPALEIKYSDKEDEVGFKPNGTEGDIGTGVTSFFVQNDIFYLLDNVNKKVLITDKSGKTSTIKLNESSWLEDVYVDKKKNIYVLDFANRIVSKYSQDGQHLNDYSIPDSLEVPTGLEVNHKGEIIVNQSQDISVNLTQGNSLTSTRPLAEEDITIKETRINENKGRITLTEAGKSYDIDIDFEESFGSITVNSLKSNQIVYTKTEVAADIPKIMAETHVYVANKKGKILGAARVPLEKMYFAPRHLVRVDKNKIYLLSPEPTKLVVYELKPGNFFNKKLKNRIQAYKMEHQAEMEAMDKNLKTTENQDLITIQANNGPNLHLHRADALSRANAMINHTWTVYAGNKPSPPASGTKLPSYVANAAVGATLTGIPYKWGGGDGKDYGAGGRKTFVTYQATDKIQTGDVDTADFGVSSVTGLDCSGFAQLAWLRTDKKYSTSSLSEITISISKSNLKYMDALNHAGFHVVLYNGASSDGIYTKEATTDGGQKAQSYSRTWYWLETTHKFVPIRYTRIADDGTPLPQL
ncbi:hypothetical protein [Bacillus sp. FJAT-27245]|uniref:hypothetical protein n=1 Tax=Bacillus sp. FJAT-27245 TaxID=1684144 RepID=UPI0006A7694E|nr:hypothetical protein [Bacillus sp. FJAT-27245]